MFKQSLFVAHRRNFQQGEQQRLAAKLFDAPHQTDRLFTRSRDDDIEIGEGQERVINSFATETTEYTEID